MKKKTLYLSILLMLFSIISYSQNITPQELHSPTGSFVDTDYCIKVYVHLIGDYVGNTTLNATELNNLNNQVNQLNTFFQGRISFEWNGQIREINNTPIYNSSIQQNGTGPLATVAYNFNLLDNYSHDDGIDLFFHGVEQIGSIADDIANGTRILFTKGHLNTPALAHEVGHVLGLFHLFHGTLGNGGTFGENDDGFGAHNVECPGVLDNTSGDYVTDTPADTGYSNENPISPCNPIAVNDSGQCGGATFDDPDLTNFMRPPTSVANSNCATQFTIGQYNRMKFFISNFSHLGQILSSYCRESECQSTPCGMTADFAYNINECTVNFNGENDGVYCANETYKWTIEYPDNTPDLVITSEDFNHTFTEDGDYNVIFKITNGTCSSTTNKTVSITSCSPPPPPSCPVSSCLDIVQVYECVDYQVWMNCNDPDIDYIKWYYTLSGSYVHQYFGISGGNPAGQHAQPLYLPSPPSSGSWNGYVLTIYAEVHFDDGSVCNDISTSTRLSCSTGGGNPMMRANTETKKSRKELLDEIDISLSKNPIKANQELNFTGIDYKDVIGIEVLDFYGNPKITMKPTKNGLNIGRLATGMYFIRFTTKYGSIQKKIIIE